MNIDIGSKIKTLRLSKSMTQDQLAKALHVSAQAVSKWENGSSLPDIQLLPALSVTLGTSIDSLFSLTDESRFLRIPTIRSGTRRFLTQQEFDEEEHFLQEKCREEETRPRATLLLAELYCKRAREYNDLASPLARQALALNPDWQGGAQTPIFDAEHGAYLDWNATNHYRTIAFYQEFSPPRIRENDSAHLWLLDLLDRRPPLRGGTRGLGQNATAVKPTYNDRLLPRLYPFAGGPHRRRARSRSGRPCAQSIPAQSGGLRYARRKPSLPSLDITTKPLRITRRR